MRIRTRLRTAALAPPLMALAVGLALLLSRGAIRVAQQDRAAARQIVGSVNDLSNLVGVYALHHGERPRQQFLAEHGALARLLSSSRFHNREQQRLLRAIRDNVESMKDTFGLMVATHQLLQSKQDDLALGRHEVWLADHLLVRSRQAAADALRLQTLVDDDIAATQRTANIVVFLLILVVTVPLTFILAPMMGSIAGNLAMLRQGTEAVGGGDLAHRIGLDGKDELADLARAFDEMTGRLQAVTVSKGELEREVEERARAQESLRESQGQLALTNAEEQRARAEAEEANRAKDQFVALVSHELRNPLNAITSAVGVLRADCPAAGRAGRALEVVERNANLQARLVNDLLDLSRLQQGKLQMQRAPVDLGKVVGTACRSHGVEAQEAGLTLTIRAEPALWVYGDFDRLQQVATNLLSNALKFTPAGGSVTVSAERHDAHARLTVTDTGIGLDRATLGHLFGMFQQGEVAGQRKPGLGLGLALVKGIVDRHGGRVWAESEGPGQGSRLIAEFPLSEAPQAILRSTAGLEASVPMRVLLVEDNADARTMIADNLTLAGYEVHAAGSGEEGLDALGDARPEVLLVDIGLPGMDGIEFLRRARQEPGMADVPAFAVTGYGAEEDVRRGREAGFIGHFVKPVNLSALDHSIRELVAGSARQGE